MMMIMMLMTMLLLLISTVSAKCNVSSIEYDALYALYYSTNGPGWSYGCNSGWVFSSPPDYSAPCSGWNGINCSMCQVTIIELTGCKMTGFLPSQLGALTSLQKLVLYINSITGTIPSQLGAMTSLYYLDLDTNILTGTIPSELASLPIISYIYLQNNRLTGTLPTQFGSMTNMIDLFLFSNSLTGTLPTQFGSMTFMKYLYLADNSLTGTIPSQLGNLTGMGLLVLSGNSLSGTIPSQLANLTELLTLEISYNSLSGTIPSQLAYITGLQYLILSNNGLIGTIPSQLANMPSLQYLILSNNGLIGTMPSQLAYMTSIQFLDLSDNRLTGNIPNLSKCTSLQYLYLQDNNLVGTISRSIFTPPLLVSINLSNNTQLGGNVSYIFSNTTKSLQNMTYMILSSMKLTGSLPPSLFSLPKLSTLVLSSNCISGTLPEQVCNSSITSLIMDGAGIGPSCSKYRQSFHGSIPSCLLASPTLVTLHLGGNGMIGRLGGIPLTSNLDDLILTYNRLTGTIPVSIQKHAFSNIDLSSNKLSGILLEAYQPPSSSINLTVNRLSGDVSSALRSSNATVNILDGNLFGCPLLSVDVNSNETACGSSNLDSPFIAWLVLSVLAVFIAIWLSYSKISLLVRVNRSEWLSALHQYKQNLTISSELYHTMSTMRNLECTCSMVIILVALYVLVVMMSLLGMKLQSSQVNTLYQVQYLYTITAAYLVGNTPTVLMWLYITLSGLIAVPLCVAVGPVLMTAAQSSDSDRCQSKRIDNHDTSLVHEYRDSIKSMIIRLAVEIVVGALAIVINIGFVYIVYFVKPSNLSSVNLAFAIIKSLVSAIIIPASTKLVSKAYRHSHVVLLTVMVNVIGPGLAVIISSPLCLYYYINEQSISASYQYPTYFCTLFNYETITCSSQTLMSASSVIVPKWFYSYECSSSFLTTYLPNYVYLYIINGIISPLFYLLVMTLISSDISVKYMTYIQKKKFPQSLYHLWLLIHSNFMVGRIFFIDDDHLSSPVAQSSVEMPVIHHSRGPKEASVTSNYDINVAEVMPTLCVDISMLLTFGLASPLLSVIIACSIIINTLLMRLALGRYISIVSKVTSSRACYEKLEKAFEDEWRCLSKVWWMMSVFVGLFWSLFVNDMIGDKNPTGGIVAAVMMIAWCPCVFISLQWLLVANPDSSSSSSGIRECVHKLSSYVHDMVWKHVLNLGTISSSSSSSSSSVEEKIVSMSNRRLSITTETISPLRATQASAFQ